MNYDEVLTAYDRIKEVVNKTPVMTSRTLNRMTKSSIYLKCENFQRIGAFKFRGAYNAILNLTENQKTNGVITHSSGNHAQAVALAAKLMGIKVTIVMPETAPQVKVNATKETYGAKIVFCKNTIQARQEKTQELIKKHNFTLIHPYNNENVIAGAGTAAYELLLEHNDLDMIFAPVGGGGLLSGTAITGKGFSSKIEIYGVEPKNVDDAYRSLLSDKIEVNETINSIADGLLTNLSERTFKIIKENVAKIITVSEEEILNAMRFIWERMKLVVEPSGACSLAGVLSGQVEIQDKKVGVIISGGNIDLTAFFALLNEKIKI